MISVEGSGQRLRRSLVDSKKMSESLRKHKNLGGKFQNAGGSDANGDHHYNNVKVVEVGSEMNDMKDESSHYEGIPNLRCSSKYVTKTYKKSSRGRSPDS